MKKSEMFLMLIMLISFTANAQYFNNATMRGQHSVRSHTFYYGQVVPISKTIDRLINIEFRYQDGLRVEDYFAQGNVKAIWYDDKNYVKFNKDGLLTERSQVDQNGEFYLKREYDDKGRTTSIYSKMKVKGLDNGEHENSRKIIYNEEDYTCTVIYSANKEITDTTIWTMTKDWKPLSNGRDEFEYNNDGSVAYDGNYRYEYRGEHCIKVGDEKRYYDNEGRILMIEIGAGRDMKFKLSFGYDREHKHMIASQIVTRKPNHPTQNYKYSYSFAYLLDDKGNWTTCKSDEFPKKFNRTIEYYK